MVASIHHKFRVLNSLNCVRNGILYEFPSNEQIRTNYDVDLKRSNRMRMNLKFFLTVQWSWKSLMNAEGKSTRKLNGTMQKYPEQSIIKFGSEANNNRFNQIYCYSWCFLPIWLLVEVPV